MGFLYNLLVQLSWVLLNVAALFNKKLKLFVNGRKNVFQKLDSLLTKKMKTVWVHVASLGEFEQGLPIIERIKKEYPDYKIVLTFFSPSGYEVKKNTSAADVTMYLPMDTRANAKRFLSIVNPKLVIFIKYEIWPNYLKELERQNIPTVLVSAIFKPGQVYFRPYGGFMRNALRTFDHFFVQNEHSKKLLESISIENITISGDTRFDRVAQILQQNNRLGFMEVFKNGKNCFVAGSTWPDDEKVLVPFINFSNTSIKYVIAPHNIKPDHIKSLVASIVKKTILYSEIEKSNPEEYDVLIIDTIGLLTKIYSYADIAYVGGGFKTGLHNTLEPAVFGVPVIIGPNYEGFQEAERLIHLQGLLTINNNQEFDLLMQRLLSDNDFRDTTGRINNQYIFKSVGATNTITDHLSQFL